MGDLLQRQPWYPRSSGSQPYVHRPTQERPYRKLINRSMKDWRARTDWNSVCARAAGRRRYNSLRRLKQRLRRREVLTLLWTLGSGRGVQARIAQRLDVSPSTICRDFVGILAPNTEETRTHRRHTSQRSLRAELRRYTIFAMLKTWGFDRGVQKRIAASLRVSSSTISRDLTTIARRLGIRHLSDLRHLVRSAGAAN